MTDNENSSPHQQDQTNDGEAKVLPFRRPNPQPTLPRRPTVATGKAPGLSKGNTKQPKSPPWKGKALQALQFAILFAALLLALKNCGRI